MKERTDEVQEKVRKSSRRRRWWAGRHPLLFRGVGRQGLLDDPSPQFRRRKGEIGPTLY